MIIPRIPRPTRSPDDGQGGAPPAGAAAAAPAVASAAAPASPGGATAPSGGADPYAVTAGVKPDGLPDKFWNPDTKAIRLSELMKGYSEANALIGKRAEDLKTPDFQTMVETRVEAMSKDIQTKALRDIRGEAPKEAKDYQLALDAETAKALPPDMQELSQYESDPLVQWFRGYAHELGLGPQQFNKAFGGYLKVMGEAQAAQRASEVSRLGENGPARIDKLAKFVQTNIEAGAAKALLSSVATADAFAALEGLVLKLQSPSLISSGFEGGAGAGSTGPALATDAEIRAAMRDPRYYDPARRDPAYVKSIERAWQMLYPTRSTQ